MSCHVPCAQSCLILCDPVGCSLPGSWVYRMSKARIQELVAISSSRGSFRPGDQTHISWVSCTTRRFLTCWANREARQMSQAELIEKEKARRRYLQHGLPWWLCRYRICLQCKSPRRCGSIPESRRCSGGEYGNPFLYSCLANSMDRGAWRITVHDVTKSRAWLSTWHKTISRV